MDKPLEPHAANVLAFLNDFINTYQAYPEIADVIDLRNKLRQRMEWPGFTEDLRHYYCDELPEGHIFKSIHNEGNGVRANIHHLASNSYQWLANGLHGYEHFLADVKSIRDAFAGAHTSVHNGFQQAFSGVSGKNGLGGVTHLPKDTLSIHHGFRWADDNLLQLLIGGWKGVAHHIKSVGEIPHDCHLIKQGFGNTRATLAAKLTAGWNSFSRKYADVKEIPAKAGRINEGFNDTWKKLLETLRLSWKRIGSGGRRVEKIPVDCAAINKKFSTTREALNKSLAPGWKLASQAESFKAIPQRAHSINNSFHYARSDLLGGAVKDALALAGECVTSMKYVPGDAVRVHQFFTPLRNGLVDGVRSVFEITAHHLKGLTNVPQDLSAITTSFNQFWKNLCDGCLIPGWQYVAAQLHSHKEIPANAVTLHRAFVTTGWSRLLPSLGKIWEGVGTGIAAITRLSGDAAHINERYNGYSDRLPTLSGIAEKYSDRRAAIRDELNTRVATINRAIENDGGTFALALRKAGKYVGMGFGIFGSAVAQGFETVVKMIYKHVVVNIAQGLTHAIYALARTAQTLGSLAIGVPIATIISATTITGLTLAQVMAHIGSFIKPSITTVLTAAAMTVASVVSVTSLALTQVLTYTAALLGRAMQSLAALVAVPLVAAGSAVAAMSLFLVQAVVHAAAVIGRVIQTATAVVGTPVMLTAALGAATVLTLAQGIAHAASALKPVLTALVVGTGMTIASLMAHTGLALAQVFIFVADIAGRTLQSVVSVLVGAPVMSLASVLSIVGLTLAQGVTHAAIALKRVVAMAATGAGMAIAHAVSYAGLVLAEGLVFAADAIARVLQSTVAFVVGVPLMFIATTLSKAGIYLSQVLTHVGDVIFRGAQSLFSLVSLPVLALAQGISHVGLVLGEGLAHAANAFWRLLKTSGSALGHFVVFTTEVTAHVIVSALEGVAHLIGALGTGIRIIVQPLISAGKQLATGYTLHFGLTSMASAVISMLHNRGMHHEPTEANSAS